jgi:hypothetical protein
LHVSRHKNDESVVMGMVASSCSFAPASRFWNLANMPGEPEAPPPSHDDYLASLDDRFRKISTQIASKTDEQAYPWQIVSRNPPVGGFTPALLFNLHALVNDECTSVAKLRELLDREIDLRASDRKLQRVRKVNFLISHDVKLARNAWTEERIRQLKLGGSNTTTNATPIAPSTKSPASLDEETLVDDGFVPDEVPPVASPHQPSPSRQPSGSHRSEAFATAPSSPVTPTVRTPRAPPRSDLAAVRRRPAMDTPSPTPTGVSSVSKPLSRKRKRQSAMYAEMERIPEHTRWKIRAEVDQLPATVSPSLHFSPFAACSPGIAC